MLISNQAYSDQSVNIMPRLHQPNELLTTNVVWTFVVEFLVTIKYLLVTIILIHFTTAMASLRISARPLLATLRHVPRACRPAPIGARTFSTSFAKWAVVKDKPPVTQTNRTYDMLLSNKFI